MSTAPTTVPTLSDLPAAPLAAGACAVCPHPLAAHDAISLRFCRATESAAATSRGCVCPST
jgi:hypothetical protein